MPKRTASQAGYVGRGRMRIMSKKRRLVLRQRPAMVPRNLSYGGRAAYARITFSQTWSMAEGVQGQGTPYAFNLNSAYDPNATGTGNQPVGYDQLSALYRKCVVTGATFEWNVANTGTQTPVAVGYWIATDTANPNVEAWPSQPGAVSRLLANTSATPVTTFRKRVNFPREYGIPMRKILDEDDYSHGTSSNPVQRLMLYVWCRGYSGQGSPAGVSGLIKITYNCKFTDAKVLDPS